MDNVADLRALLHSPHRLVLVESDDERRLLGIVRAQADELGHAVWRWSSTRGLAKDGYSAQFQTQDVHVALDFCQEVGVPSVFVFADGHRLLEDSRVLRHIKETAQVLQPSQTLLLTAPAHDVPAEHRLDVPDHLLEVSSTAARAGRRDWMAPAAFRHDVATGAWTRS